MTEEQENYYTVVDLLIDSVRTGNKLRSLVIEMTIKHLSGKGWLLLEPSIEAPYDCIKIGDEGEPEIRFASLDDWVSINHLTDLEIGRICIQLIKAI